MLAYIGVTRPIELAHILQNYCRIFLTWSWRVSSATLQFFFSFFLLFSSFSNINIELRDLVRKIVKFWRKNNLVLVYFLNNMSPSLRKLANDYKIHHYKTIVFRSQISFSFLTKIILKFLV